MNYRRYEDIVPLLFDIKALKALTTWPNFSITSYRIVSDLYKQGIRPRTVIDVGANVGQFTQAALNIFTGKITIHAFEPIESCVSKLRANTESYSNVHIYAVALGSRCEKTTFNINSYSLASSLLRISKKHKSEYTHVNEAETVIIEVSTLDHYFANAALLSPVLLKIDVQGAEKSVIEGGKDTLQLVDFVLLEASFEQMYDGEPLFLDLIDQMKALNFSFMRPISILRSPKTGEILQSDILFKNVRRS